MYLISMEENKDQPIFQNGELKEELSSYLTEMTHMLSPGFCFTHKPSPTKVAFTLNQNLVIQISELNKDFISSVKSELKEQICMQENLETKDEKTDEKDFNLGMTLINTPTLILFWVHDASSVENLCYQFNLKDFMDEEVEAEGVVYSLTTIINYYERYKIFEILSREKSTWKGSANGQEINMPHEEFLNVISALVDEPVVLAYQVIEEIPSAKFEYNERDAYMAFEDDENKEQIENDHKLAQQMQEELNDRKNSTLSSLKAKSNKDDKSPISRKITEEVNNPINVEEDKYPDPQPMEISHPSKPPLENVKLENDKQWRCKHCTLINELPNYY